jgi:phage FluMu gp28-like protein
MTIQVRGTEQGVGHQPVAHRLAALVTLKPFQEPIFWDDSTGVLVLHWSRQIGKSYVLSAWAVRRMLENPGRLVTVLSNSKDNGVEFIQKCKVICALLNVVYEDNEPTVAELAQLQYEEMQFEVRIKIGAHVSRVKVLAANPRTARGFSGDLILDEFAFHGDSALIWDAAEPIISSNPDFLCRIASTGNGVHNSFYRMCAGASSSASASNPAGFARSSTGFAVSRVSRSAAHALGQKIYHPQTRKEITHDAARKNALDKESYDQNYELKFISANSTLLNDDIISACEYADDSEYRIDEQRWDASTIEFLSRCHGPLLIGCDVGRTRDLTVLAVGEKIGGVLFIRALLRIAARPLWYQFEQFKRVSTLPNFGRAAIDNTGLGVGLVDDAQRAHGHHRVEGVHFASREERDERQALSAQRDHNRNAKPDTALVTELMGLDMLAAFSASLIRIPVEQALRDDLLKPGRSTQGKNVRIAAESDEAGHADAFWAVALCLRTSKTQAGAINTTDGVSMRASAVTRRIFRPRKIHSVGRFSV